MNSEMEKDILKVLVTEEELKTRIAELGEALYKRYEGHRPLFLGVLKGSFIFMADLMRASQLMWSSSLSALTRTAPCPAAGCRSLMISSRTSRAGRSSLWRIFWTPAILWPS